jgi:hypothetical protein
VPIPAQTVGQTEPPVDTLVDGSQCQHSTACSGQRSYAYTRICIAAEPGYDSAEGIRNIQISWLKIRTFANMNKLGLRLGGDEVPALIIELSDRKLV